MEWENIVEQKGWLHRAVSSSSCWLATSLCADYGPTHLPLFPWLRHQDGGIGHPNAGMAGDMLETGASNRRIGRRRVMCDVRGSAAQRIWSLNTTCLGVDLSGRRSRRSLEFHEGWGRLSVRVGTGGRQTSKLTALGIRSSSCTAGQAARGLELDRPTQVQQRRAGWGGRHFG